MLLEKGEPMAYGATVDATFRLAIERVASRSQAAVALMELCAFLAPEAIPHLLLRANPDGLPGALGRVVQDEVAYAEAVGVLYGFSLLERDQAGVRVHRLVQAVTRHRLDPDQRAGWARRAVTLVRDAWPEESWLPAAWPRCGQLLPHALTAADHADELPAAREPTGALLNQVGHYLGGRAELAAARATFERALAIKEAVHGPNHLEVALTLGNLGIVLAHLGELPQARAHQERTLAIKEAALGPDHPQIAATLDNLGIILRELGELPQARAHHERALAIREAAYGPNHPQVAETLSDLGLVLRELGELPQARTHQQRALEIEEAAYGPNHPQVARTLSNLSLVLRELGELPQAQACEQRAQAIRQGLGQSK